MPPDKHLQDLLELIFDNGLFIYSNMYGLVNYILEDNQDANF